MLPAILGPLTLQTSPPLQCGNHSKNLVLLSVLGFRNQILLVQEEVAQFSATNCYEHLSSLQKHVWSGGLRSGFDNSIRP
jgi:hypothetical protein